MIITIDGPAASGKSSVAQQLADTLKIYYLYTGLLYRAFAYLVVHQHGEEFISSDYTLMPTLSSQDLNLIDLIVYDYKDGEPRITINGRDITGQLYTPEISQVASLLSSNKDVRGRLLPIQRSIAHRYDIVADGRDCGTVIFPDADLKFYLTAGVDVRVRRLMNDSKRATEDDNVSFNRLKADLEMRDYRDQNREIAPLKIPKDALIIDSSQLTLDQTVQLFLHYIQEYLYHKSE